MPLNIMIYLLVLKFIWSLYAYFLNSIIETLDNPIYTDDIVLERSLETNLVQIKNFSCRWF